MIVSLKNKIIGYGLIIIGIISVIIPLWYSFIYLDESELTVEVGLITIVMVTGVSVYSVIFGYGKLQNKSLLESLK